MAETINLNNIKTGSCGCNRPHPVQPPHQPPCGCISSHQKKDEYFKVANLFNELGTDWQRAEARSNLGITEIIDLEQIKFGNGSGDSNIWKLDMRKGCETFSKYLIVKNGESGENGKDGKDGNDGKDGITPTISIGTVTSLNPESNPTVENVGTSPNVILNFGIPKGGKGDKGDKGDPGDPTNGVKSVELVSYGPNVKTFLNNQQYSGNMYVWNIVKSDNERFELWVPEGVAGKTTRAGLPKILYKKVDFQQEPTDSQLSDKLDDLLAEANISSTQGRSLSYMVTTLKWKEVPPVITSQGKQFIYMASAVITPATDTEEEQTSAWGIVQITGTKGSKGNDGQDGKDGKDGKDGDGAQGLIGPVIRYKGEWDPKQCYVNEFGTYSDDTQIHFIDVVEYQGYYYKVAEGAPIPQTGNPHPSGNCAYGTPGESADWVEAVEMDFAYINTLIANSIRSFTIDADEIRIHDTSTSDSDKIVAGMTSGHTITYNGNKQEVNDAGSVRIWAGTDVDILGTPNASGGRYKLNVQDAPFKVYQNGKLVATNAEIVGDITSYNAYIEGTVQANILRLGEHLRLNDDNTTQEGTFLAPVSGFTLPKLLSGKVQMFYILTNKITQGSTIQVCAQEGDYIKEADTTANTQCFAAKAEKLYQLFGIDHIWYVVESDMKAASEQIPDIRISLATASMAGASVCHGVTLIDNLTTHRVWNFENPTMNISNNESNPTLFTFPNEKLYYLYAQYERTSNDITKTYIKEVGTITIQFVSQRYNFGSIIIDGNTTHENTTGTLVNNKWEFTIKDDESNVNKTFGVVISTQEISEINADNETMTLIMSENRKYNDAFEHEISSLGMAAIDEVPDCLPMSSSMVTYVTLRQRDTTRLLGTIRPNN